MGGHFVFGLSVPIRNRPQLSQKPTRTNVALLGNLVNGPKNVGFCGCSQTEFFKFLIYSEYRIIEGVGIIGGLKNLINGSVGIKGGLKNTFDTVRFNRSKAIVRNNSSHWDKAMQYILQYAQPLTTAKWTFKEKWIYLFQQCSINKRRHWNKSGGLEKFSKLTSVGTIIRYSRVQN